MRELRKLARKNDYISKQDCFSPRLLCPDSRQKDSAQGSPYLEMLEKDSWVLEDDLKYAGEVVSLCILNIVFSIRKIGGLT